MNKDKRHATINFNLYLITINLAKLKATYGGIAAAISSRSATKRRPADEFRQKRGALRRDQMRSSLLTSPISTEPARSLASEPSGGRPLVAFGFGPRLANERDTHAALRVPPNRRSGIAMGFRFRCHGGSHSPNTALVRPPGITEGREVCQQRRLYRKAPLFDRFVKFNVQVEGSDTRH